MRVAIAQVDGKWPNLALAKLAAWHRGRGDEVGRFNPLFPAGRTYASKVFTDTPDDPYLPDDAVRGGSAYDFTTVLDDEVERTRPDWSAWPWWKHDVGFTTRGCVRRCPFCIVPRKEGRLRVVAEFGDVWTGRRTMYLHDNNITAAPIEHFRKVTDDASRAKVYVSFDQGFDARLLTDEHAAIIGSSGCFRRGIKGFEARVHLAFDHVGDEEAVRRSIRLLEKHGTAADRLTYYVLIGYDSTPEEDTYRVELLRSLGAHSYAMPFNRRDPYQSRFCRWVNSKPLFETVPWIEYRGARVVTP